MNTVIITDLRRAEAREAAAFLTEAGYRVVTVPEAIPLWDEEALTAFAAPYREDLIGVIHPAPPVISGGILEITPQQWDHAAQEGAVAALVVTKVFCGIFREKGAGSFIFLNSFHAEKPVGKGLLFSIGCGAADMLSREAYQDYGAHNVHVYFVEKGITGEDFSAKSDVSPIYCGTDLRYPARKLPENSYLNGLLAFLLTEAAAPLAGSPIRADQGLMGFYNIHREKKEGVRYHESAPAQAPLTELSQRRRDPEEIEAALQEDPAEERVALITGGGKGVGAGIVRVLTSKGIRCCIGCHSNVKMAEEVEAEVKARGGEAFIYPADVSDPEQVEAMVQEVIRRYGRLDILVNNAAMQPNRYIDEYTAESFRKLWEINIGGYFNAVRAALPYIRRSPAGRIINMSSVHGKRPAQFDAGYAMTKGAIRMFTRELALELIAEKIPVNALDLGAVQIEFKTGGAPWHTFRPLEISNPEMPAYPHFVLPEEVGAMVWFLLSRAGSSVDGDGIRIDRGLVLY